MLAKIKANSTTEQEKEEVAEVNNISCRRRVQIKQTDRALFNDRSETMEEWCAATTISSTGGNETFSG